MTNNDNNEEEVLILIDEDGNEVILDESAESFITEPAAEVNSEVGDEDIILYKGAETAESADEAVEEVPDEIDLALTQVIGEVSLDEEYVLDEAEAAAAYESDLDVEELRDTNNVDYDDDEEYEEDGILAGTTGKLLMLLGALVIVIAIAVIGISVFAKKTPKEEKVDFSQLGTSLVGIGVIGAPNIDAIANAEGLRLEALYEAQKTYDYDEADQENGISSVSITLTSILKDLKIKMVNSKGKLIGNVPFEVEVTGPDGKTETVTDSDKDGVIYLSDIPGGTYKVKIVPLNGYDSMYDFSTCKGQSLAVKTQLDYQKVDVKNEIKNSSQVDKSEDAAEKEIEVESKLKDTVGYVMSSKTASSNGYEAISKSKITDPFETLKKKLVAVNGARFKRLSAINNPPVATEEGDGETPGETPAEHNHSYGGYTSNGEGNHTGHCSCGETTVEACDTNGTDGACSKCGYKSAPAATHTHNYVWKNGEDKHWKECTADGECDAKKIDEATCTYEYTKQGTLDDKRHTCECTVCHFVKAENEACTEGANGKCVKCQAEVFPSATISFDKNKVELSVTDANKKSATVTVKTDKIIPTPTPPGFTYLWSVTGTDSTIVKLEDERKETVKITAEKAGKVTLCCKVTYTDAAGNTQNITQPTVEVEVSGYELTLNKTGKQVLFALQNQSNRDAEKDLKLEVKATLAKAKGSNINLTWKVANEAVAKFFEAPTTADEGENRVSTCVLWGLSAGTTELSCMTPDGTVVQKLTVVVSANPKADKATKLIDNEGKQVFVYDAASKKYVEATYADYYTGVDLFTPVEVSYIYNGWWTIDGKTYYFDSNGKKVTGDQVILGAKYSFDGNGVLKSGTGQFGIDVSTWNGSIDWSKVAKSGVSYAIIRCGFRGTTVGGLVEDNKFESNVKNATEAGIKVGVYFFTQAITEAEAVEEASMCLALCDGKKLTYPIFIDVESATGGRANGLSKDARTAIVKAFCKTITNGGRKAGIYANKNWFTNQLNVSQLTEYTIWLAQYTSAPSYTASRYDLWQYSNQGSISGISGNVDLDLNYLGY